MPQMNAHETDDFVLSRKPLVRVRDVRLFISRLNQNDRKAKGLLINVIHHRLHNRYVRPLLRVPRKFKSGFLMMAASCLLIETLQSFYEGWEDTKGRSEDAFKSFFERDKEFFPKFAECFPKAVAKGGKGNFYANIRCGILHQAETTDGYSIVRDKSPLFDEKEKTINANEFMKALEACLTKYKRQLRVSPSDSPLWKNATKKLTYICDNCGG